MCHKNTAGAGDRGLLGGTLNNRNPQTLAIDGVLRIVCSIVYNGLHR